MRIFFHPNFYKSYNNDLLSEPGRMECVIDSISSYFDISSSFYPATEKELLLGHLQNHIDLIKERKLFDISALATGAAIQAAKTSIKEPAFAIARPGGHHAMKNKAWGFCFFSSMAISALCLHQTQKDKKIFILDFDYHYGNGTNDILGDKSWVEIFDIPPFDRKEYMEKVEQGISIATMDFFAVSAGFDHHEEDIGRQIKTEDYAQIGRWVHQAVKRNNANFYGILEGGYNYDFLGKAVLAFLQGVNL